ncbi:MAG TPA: LysR substrate-binding domain-containing protein [Planctomycetota bacterium]|nr:LysR substrate-binding domain-containing protein [Planctomycetota bacterium]
MELRHLRYFVAVAEECHFGRAARRLFISQPPLSRQIRDLEEEIGLQLLERTRTQVRLTAAGRQFLEGARQTLVQAERTVALAKQAAEGKTGFLSIGYIPTGDLGVIPKVLRPFRKQYPNIELELRSLPVAPQIDELRRERIHLGFLRLPVHAPDLRIEHVHTESLIVALREKHPLSRHSRIGLERLASEDFLVFPRRLAPAYYDEIISFFRKAGISPRIGHEVESLQTQLALVSAGLGFALLPSSAREIRRRGVIYRDLDEPVPRVDVAVATLDRTPSETLGHFLKVVRQCYRSPRSR